MLLFGGAIIFGWVTSKALATTFFALLAMVGFIAWAVIIISVLAGAPDRSWLAAALERVNPRLLDRLNTLLFLERRPRDARAALVRHAHRPANPGGAGGESGAVAVPGHPRAGVYAGVHRGAGGDGPGVSALLALEPVAGRREGQSDSAGRRRRSRWS